MVKILYILYKKLSNAHWKLSNIAWYALEAA